MPAVSSKQQKFMAICSHSPGAAKGSCPSHKVAEEFSHKPAGGYKPKHSPAQMAKAMKAAKVAEKVIESPVFVIDQVNPKTGKFDGHKTIMGARGFAEAKQMYDAGFADKSGPDRRGAITKMQPEEFKQWKAGDTTKPVKWQPTRSQEKTKSWVIRNKKTGEVVIS